MPKEKKTGEEIATLIGSRLHHPARLIQIEPDQTFGWAVRVIGARAQQAGLQAHADAIAAELRGLYDLAD